VGADADARRRDFAQHGVEPVARMSVVDRVDPDQRAVDPEQLVAQRIRLAAIVDGGAGVDAPRGEGSEDAAKRLLPGVARRRTSASPG